MKNYLLLIIAIFFLFQCSEGDSNPQEFKAPIVSNINVKDIGNNGDGRDLEISFSKVNNESFLLEYRVFVVKRIIQGNFDLSAAENTSTSNYLKLEVDGMDKKIVLNEGSTDVDGEKIANSIEYVVFVLSIADGTNAKVNALSSASTSIILGQSLITAPAVDGILVDDISNNANGTDLQIMFNKVIDESLISEYRIFAVPIESQFLFDLSMAEQADENNYVVVQSDGTNNKITFEASSNDSDGKPITEYVEYVVFVLSVADGTIASLNSLSVASSPVLLTRIKIVYLGNDGVYITDGEKGLIVDALPGDLSGWIPFVNNLQFNIEQGNSPYDNIGLAMITHNHGDHFNSSSTSTFLAKNPSVKLLAPSQVRGSISAGQDQIEDFTLALDEQIDLIIDEIPIRIMRIRHFTPQNGADFSSSESLAFLIELGGKKILHIGDGDLSAENFGTLDLHTENIDVALIPTFTFSGQLTGNNKAILIANISPENIIGLHLGSTTTVSTVQNIYPDATVFTQSLQFVQY